MARAPSTPPAYRQLFNSHDTKWFAAALRGTRSWPRYQHDITVVSGILKRLSRYGRDEAVLKAPRARCRRRARPWRLASRRWPSRGAARAPRSRARAARGGPSAPARRRRGRRRRSRRRAAQRGERRLVDDRPARRVDEVRGALHGGELLGADQVMRGRPVGAVQRDDIGDGQQLVELDPPRAQLGRDLGAISLRDW